VATESGLRYAFLSDGDGETPDFGSTVTVHFKLWLEDGSLLADSYASSQPAPFTLGAEEIIAAWDEMAALMRVGDVVQMIVPPELGLGAAGGGPIPPDATLIFELELLDFQPPPPPPTEVDEESFIETESGLRYVFLEEADGPLAASGDSVTVNYAGWLTNTIQFDNSYDRGEPFTLVADTGSVIPGWDEMLLLMPQGSKVQVYIPGDLAYGASGRPGIPPNATLIFEIELLEVSPAEPSE
jgi:FKBP-type peptidyl-prolyl cis-trans isomerase